MKISRGQCDPGGFILRELVTSTTVILAPGACGQGVRKRSHVPTLAGKFRAPAGKFRALAGKFRAPAAKFRAPAGKFWALASKFRALAGKFRGRPVGPPVGGGRPVGPPVGGGGKSKSAQTRHYERFTSSYHAQIDQ